MTNLRIFSAGNRKKQTIIFIHGFCFDYTMWQKQIDFFSDDYHCFLYDIRGLGKSLPGDGQFTIEMFVDDLFDLIKYFEIEKPILCSLSMGGYIALRAYEKKPNSFRALILCDTKSDADTNEAKLKRASAINHINKVSFESYINEFVPVCFSDKTLANNKDVYNNILNTAMASDPKGVKGCLIAMAGRTDTTESLSNINIPVLLVCGEDDKITPPDVMKKMKERIKGSQLEIIPEAGHLSPVENPEYFNNKLKDFLLKTSANRN